MFRWRALHNEPPATAPATLDTRNAQPVLDFVDSADRYAIFSEIVPDGVALTTGITVVIWWKATTATSGDVRLGVEFERGTTDSDAYDWGTATYGTSTASGTSGISAQCVIVVTQANLDGVLAGEPVRMRLTRTPLDALDTLVGDIEFVLAHGKIT